MPSDSPPFTDDLNQGTVYRLLAQSVGSGCTYRSASWLIIPLYSALLLLYPGIMYSSRSMANEVMRCNIRLIGRVRTLLSIYLIYKFSRGDEYQDTGRSANATALFISSDRTAGLNNH